MTNPRYDYAPIIRRKALKWPEGARIALWVAPNIEYFHFDKPIRGSGSSHVPDVPGYTLRDYGSRIGVFRLMRVLDKHRIRASVLLNAEVCSNHPEIIEEGNKRSWEWLGHGMTNSTSMLDYPAEEERDVIRQVRQIITTATGKAPKGWLGPGLGETFNTPDHLAAEGFEYVSDWGCDEQPVPVRVKSGRMIIVPYELGINDIRIFIRENRSAEEYYRMVCDQFDTLYGEAAESSRVMCLPLHPFVIGLPQRIKYLDKALDYICSHEGVWRATGWEIADWYYQNYYEDPGRYER
ncbi:MAG: polysaccharide deacetylase family protein [Deltaproteobacteria bacterium]|nr:polysaccharide deacetylase family protein [Deltaproteobacteria bacterium]